MRKVAWLVTLGVLAAGCGGSDSTNAGRVQRRRLRHRLTPRAQLPTSTRSSASGGERIPAPPALRHSRVPMPIPPSVQHRHSEVAQSSRFVELDDPLSRANEGILHDVLGDGGIVGEEKRNMYEPRVVRLEARTKNLGGPSPSMFMIIRLNPRPLQYVEHQEALPGCTPPGTRCLEAQGGNVEGIMIGRRARRGEPRNHVYVLRLP
jgi:hypothetical protein